MAWAEKGKELPVKVPLEFKGEDVCPGLKKGLHSFHFYFHFIILLLLLKVAAPILWRAY